MLAFCLLGDFAYFLLSADIFQNQLFQKILSGIPSECQTVWIQIRTDRKSVLIWVQACLQMLQKQTALVGKELINTKIHLE